MQAIYVTRQSRITQQLIPSTTALSFVCCAQFTCKKEKLLMTFGITLVFVALKEKFKLCYMCHFYVNLQSGCRPRDKSIVSKRRTLGRLGEVTLRIAVGGAVAGKYTIWRYAVQT